MHARLLHAAVGIALSACFVPDSCTYEPAVPTADAGVDADNPYAPCPDHCSDGEYCVREGIHCGAALHVCVDGGWELPSDCRCPPPKQVRPGAPCPFEGAECPDECGTFRYCANAFFGPYKDTCVSPDASDGSDDGASDADAPSDAALDGTEGG